MRLFSHSCSTSRIEHRQLTGERWDRAAEVVPEQVEQLQITMLCQTSWYLAAELG
jgi:hypothetical protein